MKVVGFIPARGGSTRVPKKNLQPINGIPLCLWAANNLNRILPKQDIYIDSDDEEILGVAKKYGFNTLKRPDDLATNATDGNTFMLWEASQIKADIYIQHLPPMIFLKKETLNNCLKAVKSGDHDSAVAVVKEALYLWDKTGPKYDLKNIPNSYTLEPTIFEGMGLYITTADSLLKQKTRFGSTPYLAYIDKYEQIDIDYPEDLEMARTLARGMPSDSPYLEGLQDLKRQGKNIKLLVLDVDGTMTDGGMAYTSDGLEFKQFNTKDGRGIIEIQKQGVEVAIISSGIEPKIIESRAKTLGIKKVYVGKEKKDKILQAWMEELNLKPDHIAYIGDDINDLPVRDLVGLFATPSDGVKAVKEVADIILTKQAGSACVREFIDDFLMDDH